MLFAGLLMEGLTSGCAIGVVAMTLTLIYSTTKVFHVAHAGIFTLAGYVTWYLGSLSIPFMGTLMVAMCVCALVGALIQNQLYERLLERGAGPLVLLVASLGALTILRSSMAAIFSPDILQVRWDWGSKIFNFAGVTLSYPQFLLLISGPLLLCTVMVWSHYSVFGKRARAVAANRFLAQIMLLRPARVRAFVMALGSAAVAIPGCLIVVDRGVQPYTGTLPLLTAIIAMVLGEIGNMAAAFVAAIILSVLQSLSTLIIPGAWSAAATFGIFIITMMVKPVGLFAPCDSEYRR